MARVLVRINRNVGGRGDDNVHTAHFFGGEGFRNHPYVVLTKDVTPDGPEYVRHAEFFEVEERDLDYALQQFALKNPGCEVQAFSMTHSGICPAGEFVKKTVTPAGVLPA